MGQGPSNPASSPAAPPGGRGWGCRFQAPPPSTPAGGFPGKPPPHSYLESKSHLVSAADDTRISSLGLPRVFIAPRQEQGQTPNQTFFPFHFSFMIPASRQVQEAPCAAREYSHGERPGRLHLGQETPPWGAPPRAPVTPLSPHRSCVMISQTCVTITSLPSTRGRIPKEHGVSVLVLELPVDPCTL